MWSPGVLRPALALLALLAGAWLAEAADRAAAPEVYEWQLPRGFPPPAVPADNPMTPEKVSLGRLLFYEPRLSISRRQACGTCHNQSLAFTDGKARAIGATGEPHPRSAMSLANVAYSPVYTWTDAGFSSLEAQVLQPLLNEHPVEMGLKGRESAVLSELESDGRYREAFARAFPQERDPLTMANLARALASFERTLISGRSAFDRYVFDDERTALDAPAKRGMGLFFSERIGCSQCHFGLNFSGPIVHARATQANPAFVNTGAGRFRVPTLRNVAVTAPYMHDGAVSTLAEVLDLYATTGRGHPATPAESADRDQRLRPFALSSVEKEELLGFLASLTDEEFLGDSRFAPP
ncbi:MAG TPA: cytochrome c peroxidase [Steroidobacteraceae bacterium]|nr:cytochrome c peroxidase [Steroidobacteraceae bacterium]